MIVDGFDETLCFAFRTDNEGPPTSVEMILNIYLMLRVQFPGDYSESSSATSSLFIIIILMLMIIISMIIVIMIIWNLREMVTYESPSSSSS